MIEKEDLTESGIESGRTDVNKRGIVETLKRELDGLYATVSGYEGWAKQRIEGAIIASLTIPSGIGVLAGEVSIGVAYALMLTVLLGTVKLVDLTERAWYLEDMSSRVSGFLSGGALITAVVAIVGFGSPTVALVQSMALVWATIWLIGMFATTIKGMLRMPV